MFDLINDECTRRTCRIVMRSSFAWIFGWRIDVVLLQLSLWRMAYSKHRRLKSAGQAPAYRLSFDLSHSMKQRCVRDGLFIMQAAVVQSNKHCVCFACSCAGACSPG